MAESRWFERFYSLETPEDSRRLYSEWARTYGINDLSLLAIFRRL